MPFAPELYIHELTRKQLKHLVDQPPHAVLLYGPRGVGVTTIAMKFADEVTHGAPTHVIAPIDDKDITIEQIRTLYDETKTVTTSGRAIIIDDAERMGIAAQNALLKLLEEPPHNVYFILVCHDLQRLLPTILSRAQTFDVRPVSQEQTKEIIETLGLNSVKTAQVMFLAHGKPAQLIRLIRDDSYFATEAATAKAAREFLQASTYDRLITTMQFSNDRQKAIHFVAMLGSVLYSATRQHVDQLSAETVQIVDATLERLSSNGNIRLVLMNLALSF